MKVNGRNVRDFTDVELAFNMTDLLATLEIQEQGWREHVAANPTARVELAFPKLGQYRDELHEVQGEMRRREKVNAPSTAVVLLEVQTILKAHIPLEHNLWSVIPWKRIAAALKHA